MKDPFYREKKAITILYFFRKRLKNHNLRVNNEMIKEYWSKKGWNTNLPPEQINSLANKIPTQLTDEQLQRLIKKRMKAALYPDPEDPTAEKPWWLPDELISESKKKGYAILRGRNMYEPSGFRIEYRDEDGQFRFSRSPSQAVAGYGFDLTLDEATEFIHNAKPRFPRC